jgi:hypothetical protein
MKNSSNQALAHKKQNQVSPGLIPRRNGSVFGIFTYGAS